MEHEQYCGLQKNWDFLNGFQRFSGTKLVQKSVENRWASSQLICNQQYVSMSSWIFVFVCTVQKENRIGATTLEKMSARGKSDGGKQYDCVEKWWRKIVWRAVLRVCSCMHVCMCVCMCACMHVWICMSTCISLCTSDVFGPTYNTAILVII